MKMKQLILMIFLMLFALCNLAFSQDLSPSLSVGDIQQMRQLIADRDYYKRAFEESERQKDAWQKSSADWQNLYNSEKARADGVQESRVSQLQQSVAELGKANAIFKLQAADDKQKLSEQAFTIRKLKSERKWYFGAGMATGLAVGGYAGYQARARFSF